HEVRCAANGAEAMEAVRADSPRVLVLDVMMPELDGLGVLRALRATGLLEGLIVVVYTATSDDDTLREALCLGARELVLKGTGWDELYGRVAKHLAADDELAAANMETT